MEQAKSNSVQEKLRRSVLTKVTSIISKKIKTMQYTLDYFIDKFSKIPDEKWITGDWWDGVGCCAGGHCGARTSSTDVDEFNALGRFIYDVYGYSTGVPDINDGKDTRYQQPTPKQRILAVLHDIKKLNSEPLVKECDATKVEQRTKAGSIKTVIKYVSVPETIHESLPETVLS